VLFGGRNVQVHLDDTWEWDGTTWTRASPASSPPSRHTHGMTYDAARQRVVLVGGLTETGHLTDTWEWDGTSWVERTATATFPAFAYHHLGWDEARQRLVAHANGTWGWDVDGWVQLASTNLPQVNRGTLAWDGERQGLMMHGGLFTPQTWLWDGMSWAQLMLVAMPGATSTPAMVFDSRHRRMTLFDGVNTWVLLPP
jgi:hypothetical protein